MIIGVVNHLIACLIVVGACVFGGFSCAGERFGSVITVYTVTLFTPQVALEVILLLALFLINNALQGLRQNGRLLLLFVASLALPIVLMVLSASD